MFVRRCVFAAFWLVLGLFVLNHPANAARSVRAAVTGLALLADALSQVVSAF